MPRRVLKIVNPPQTTFLHSLQLWKTSFDSKYIIKYVTSSFAGFEASSNNLFHFFSRMRPDRAVHGRDGPPLQLLAAPGLQGRRVRTQEGPGQDRRRTD